MKSTILIILCFFSSLGAVEIPLQLTHAVSPEEKIWGLMGKSHLNENEGMLFHYQPQRVVSIWMFNVQMDLDVAFLDSNFTIQSIHTLKAYPEMMDNNRSVNELREIQQYSSNDPIIRFFRDRAVSSKTPVSFALEMPSGWFKKNNIVSGDLLTINENTSWVIVK